MKSIDDYFVLTLPNTRHSKAIYRLCVDMHRLWMALSYQRGGWS